MAVDRRGQKLHVGDIVSVLCTVKGIDREGKLGLLVETVIPSTGETHRQLLFNCEQVELVQALGDSALDIDVRTALSDSGLLKEKDLQ